jgi:hypothetical protein
MREPDIEGVATHGGPESCGGGREGVGEALTGDVQAGPLSRENGLGPGCRRCLSERKATPRAALARAVRGPRANQGMHGISMRENREVPRSPVPVVGGGPHGEGRGRKPVMHERGKSDSRVVPAKRVSRTLKEESCRRHLHRRCCARDGGLLALQRRPSGAGAKPPCAALAEDRRGERSGKRRGFDRVRWGPGKRSRSVRPGRPGRACAVEASKRFRRHRNRGSCFIPRDEPGGCPCIGQAVPGVEAA